MHQRRRLRKIQKAVGVSAIKAHMWDYVGNCDIMP